MCMRYMQVGCEGIWQHAWIVINCRQIIIPNLHSSLFVDCLCKSIVSRSHPEVSAAGQNGDYTPTRLRIWAAEMLK